ATVAGDSVDVVAADVAHVVDVVVLDQPVVQLHPGAGVADVVAQHLRAVRVAVDVLDTDHQPGAAGRAEDLRVLDGHVLGVPQAHPEALAGRGHPDVAHRDVGRADVQVVRDGQAVQHRTVAVHLEPAAAVPVPAGALGRLAGHRARGGPGRD